MKKYLVFFLIVLIGIQFIDAKKTNPPVTDEVHAPPVVLKILKKSCYDCHSNRTNWPLYADIAPISWYVVGHVNEVREKLNFTEWDKISHANRIKIKRKILKEISEGDMPLQSYIYMHPQAEVTFDEQRIIQKWATEK